MEKGQFPENQIFRHTIAVEALPRLEILVAEHNQRVARLAKRHKISIAPATMRVIRTFERARASKQGGDIKYWLAEAEVSGQQARIGGWEVLGSLVSTDQGEGAQSARGGGGAGRPEVPAGGYLLSPIGKDVDLSGYKDRGGQCDHCGTARPRSVTYILRHAATPGGMPEAVKLVGSTCLKDFTGHLSPSAMAMYADSLVLFADEISELEDDDGEEEEHGGGGYFRQSTAVALAEYLGFVAREIRIDGWVSRAKAESMGKRATANVAWMDLQRVQHQRWMREQILLGATGEQLKAKAQMMLDTFSTGGQVDPSRLVGLTAGDAESTERACREAILADARIEAAKLDEEMGAALPTPADVARAADDIGLVSEAFAAKKTRDEYEEKLLGVINQGFAFDRNIGIAASICAAADRIRRDRDKEEARELEKNEWFGTEDVREAFILRLVYTQPIDGAYGRSYLHIFLDAEGRKAKWFSSSECLDKGAYEIKATVKNHEIYQGRKITQLSRCKVVRELTGEAMACPF
jgi:hypothetical protein